MGAGKHTPGPWRVGPIDDTVVVDAAGYEVAAIDGDYNTPDQWPVMEANARLIAAAPDLLAASKVAAGFIGRLVPTKEGVAAYEALKAAIAKAEGR